MIVAADVKVVVEAAAVEVVMAAAVVAMAMICYQAPVIITEPKISKTCFSAEQQFSS